LLWGLGSPCTCLTHVATRISLEDFLWALVKDFSVLRGLSSQTGSRFLWGTLYWGVHTHFYIFTQSTILLPLLTLPFPPSLSVWGAPLLFQKYYPRCSDVNLHEPSVWEACLLECVSTYTAHHTGTCVHTLAPADCTPVCMQFYL
jgi:hypothetical protein